LKAVVLLDRSGMALHLPVRNVSRGGVLVGALGNDLSAFQLGSTHHVIILDEEVLNPRQAAVDARVVRHDAVGMALSWDDSDSAVESVGAFLDAFYSKR
jgi:hypothetical protein